MRNGPDGYLRTPLTEHDFLVLFAAESQSRHGDEMYGRERISHR
jgi:hypothetical protein